MVRRIVGADLKVGPYNGYWSSAVVFRFGT